MAFLHLNFDNFEFRDLGHCNIFSFKVLAPTHVNIREKYNYSSNFHEILTQCLWIHILSKNVERKSFFQS